MIRHIHNTGCFNHDGLAVCAQHLHTLCEFKRSVVGEQTKQQVLPSDAAPLPSGLD